MKNYKTLLAELSEAMWPGSPEYKKKYGETPSDGGSRHNIERSSGVVRATRKYDASSGESEEPTKSREDSAVAPAKRGRGRPPGKYGSYKKKVKESLDILEALDTEEEIDEFINSLDEESFAELEEHFALDEVSWQTAQAASNKSAAKVVASKSPEEREKNVAQMKRLHKGAMDRINATPNTKKGPSGYQRSTAGRLGEEAEELDEAAMSHAAKTTMKHVKNPTKGEKEAAKYIKPGIAGYSDRAAMLKSAETRGGVKEEVVDEKYMGAEKLASELKSKGAKDPKALAAWIGRKKYGKAEFQKAAAAGEKMRESEEEVDEALKNPSHQVLDKNKNNRLDKEDFAILRGEKKATMEETTDDSIAMLAAFITKQAKGEA